jgi:hypothetical protein
LPIIGALLLIALFATQDALPAQAQEGEPIAAVGHGAFFDSRGRQIVPTADWVARTQAWYHSRLVSGLNRSQQTEFAALERRMSEGLDLDGQERLVVQQRSLDWLAARTPRTVANGRMRAKLNALSYRLNWRLPRSENREQLRTLERFRLDPRIEARLRAPEFSPRGGVAALVTTNSGQAYINECAASDVPIPPSINVLDAAGTAGWRSMGFIPQSEQFIIGTPAELRVFESSDGMCIALPRYTDNSMTDVMLDGVICLSRVTSRVCFWDNQWDDDGNPATTPVTFEFPAGTQIPIGVANTMVNPAGLYQAGGAEIEFGPGGVCTDCHAGENPYIIHPLADLGGGYLMGDLAGDFPTFGPNRYDPIVGASWPQNQFSLSQPLVPPVCVGCHRQPSAGGTAGRFPHLSTEYNGSYCPTILQQAINLTMPPGAGGSQAANPAVTAFQAWCGVPTTSGPSTRGDPHLTTTNGVNYDFQAAGEFTALRNSDSGFELQTRQTPVLTSFTPGANAYTGLASCVSLNTAAAVRVGRHRISYQPSPGRPASAEQMQLRIDGRAVALAANGVDLGTGNRIVRAASGGLDIRLDDGTRVVITPNYWASQGYWYLNIEVLDSPAREGTMGHIMAPNWLPAGPNGASFGPAPASLSARHLILNRGFANAWRVTNATSLFDYAPGTSTATFTNRAWPPPSGASCTTLRGDPRPGRQPRRPVAPMRPEIAERLCGPIEDRAAHDNCVFDLTATGNEAMAEDYLRTLRARQTAFPVRPDRPYRPYGR